MIQQIWCFRLWRKSGVTEIRPLLQLQRWYIDLKLLYDRSAVLSNSHTSLASTVCYKTKKNGMKFMFTVFDCTISHYFIFCIFADVYIIAIYENAWKNPKKVSLLCFIAIVTFLHSWIYKTFSCNKLNSIKAVQLLNWFRLSTLRIILIFVFTNPNYRYDEFKYLRITIILVLLFQY